MVVIHHSTCVSHRGWDRRTPTRVNDQSLQRKWRCMSFGSGSLPLKRNKTVSGWKTAPLLSLSHFATTRLSILSKRSINFSSVCQGKKHPFASYQPWCSCHTSGPKCCFSAWSLYFKRFHQSGCKNNCCSQVILWNVNFKCYQYDIKKEMLIALMNEETVENKCDTGRSNIS